ncbi:MAG: phosphatase PAP2 family protein [Muribaculaceae bacterium]|nr:phosphatase PAP2 family protein [Muribaculaceae bacterium]
MKTISALRQSFLAGLLATSAISLLGNTDHRTDPDHCFLYLEDAPSSVEILMTPPDTTSMRFAYDREQYEWGKTLRDTERGRQAISDANLDWNTDWANDAFGEAFGSPITMKENPELYKLIYNMEEDAGGLATYEAKNHYRRTRPFVYWNEHTSTPKDEAALARNGSYPSGHTSIGWATALVLAEINPARATEILKRGFEFGQSRVIVGAHYQSDVDAGRVVGAGIVSILHTNKDFQKQLAKAKKEFARKHKIKK